MKCIETPREPLKFLEPGTRSHAVGAASRGSAHEPPAIDAVSSASLVAFLTFRCILVLSKVTQF